MKKIKAPPNSISLILATILAVAYYFIGPVIYTHINFANAVQATITFASIVIAFYGVVFTSIIGIKINIKSDDQETLVANFFTQIDIKDFQKEVMNTILNGFVLVLISILLFFIDNLLFDKKMAIALWIFMIIYFSVSTYRIMSAMITLMFQGDNKVRDNKLDEIERGKLRTRHKTE